METNRVNGYVDPQSTWGDYGEEPIRDVCRTHHHVSLPETTHQNRFPDRFNTSSYQPVLDRPETHMSYSAKSFSNKVAEASTTLEVDIFSIMAMIHELAQTQKKSAREIRHHEYQQKWLSLENAAKEMRDSAGKEFAAALIQGALQVAGGLVSAGITIKSTYQTHKIMKDLRGDGGEGMMWQQNRFQGELQLQQNLSNIAQVFTQLAQGVGTLISAPLTYSSKLDLEEQKQQEAESEKHSAYIEELKDFIDTMKEIMQNVISKLAAIEQSKHETRQKIFS